MDAAVGALFPPPLLLLLLPELLQALHASSMANKEIFKQEDERSARSVIAWLEPRTKSTCNKSLRNGHQSCRDLGSFADGVLNPLDPFRGRMG
jgi:hypothetical protein